MKLLGDLGWRRDTFGNVDSSSWSRISDSGLVDLVSIWWTRFAHDNDLAYWGLIPTVAEVTFGPMTTIGLAETIVLPVETDGTLSGGEIVDCEH